MEYRIKTDGLLEQKFFNKVVKKEKDDCWVWRGAQDKGGYGRISHKSRSLLAHRVSWVIHNGEIPELKDADYRGTCVLHKCDVRNCVNPNHLWLGTNRDNILDAWKKGRAAEQTGEKNHNATLTEEVVMIIRELHKNRPELKRKKLSEEFGVTYYTVSDIINRRTWKHI